MTSTVIVAVVIVYLVVLLILGAWGSRDSRSMAGYYVAGKKLPSWVIAFSSNSTGESAWLLLGLTGMGYLIGIHAMWIVIGEVLGVTLAWTLVALPFKEYTDRFDSITVPDYLESRFQDKGHLLRIASFVIIFSMVTAYTAAQLTASGKAFGSFLGTSYTAGVLIGTAVILFYTSVGGFKAVAYTDLLQGVLMFGGLLVLPVVGIGAVGGWSELVSRLEAIDPNLLRPLGELGPSVRGWMSALSFIGIGFAFLGAPQLLTRFMAARDRRQIVVGRRIAIACIIVFDTGAVLGGMAGRVLFPGLADSETILPTMSLELFPALFAGLYLVIVLAAIMSTVDSLLILASSAVVRDVIQQILHPRIPEERLSLYGKLTTVVIGGAALVFALGEVRMIFWFVLFAWSGLASAFTPVVLCSLFWKRTTRAGALAGMLAGFLTAILWVLFFKESFFDLYEMIPGFLAGFVATIGVSLVTAPPERAETEYHAVWKAVRSPSASSRVPAADEAD
jgi:sodium/proline symporter